MIVQDNEGKELVIPTKLDVCQTCEGKGCHVNPSIDGHGISQEEWDRDWDEDSRQGYFNGRYDVTCVECKGNKVVPVPDWENMTEAQTVATHEYFREMNALRAMEEAERNMGA